MGTEDKTVCSTMETAEKNRVKLTITVSPEEFLRGLQFSYNRNKNRFDVSGFRKGKVPRRVIERMYGAEVFYDDAINHILPNAYETALDTHGVEPVYRPAINLESADEQNGAVFTALVYVKPEVTVDGYYGLTYVRMETEPTEGEIQEKLQGEREKNARIVTVERPAEMGDVVTINFEGFLEGEPFEGGKGTDYDLTLGSKSFIDTFEEQLIGHGVGDDVEVNVTFPEKYNNEALQGKPAVFKVEILEVKGKEYPEINDEFAQDVSEFETLSEYREDLAKQIRTAKEEQALTAKRSAVVTKLVERADMDVPEVMYTARVEEMVAEFKHRLQQQGIEFEMWLRYTQMSEETFMKNYEKPAKEDVDATLALEAVAVKEGFTISEEEMRAHIEKIAARMNSEYSVDELMERMVPERRKEISRDLLNQKALDFLVEKAVAVEADAAENMVVNLNENTEE
jgi:trigger factor